MIFGFANQIQKICDERPLSFVVTRLVWVAVF